MKYMLLIHQGTTPTLGRAGEVRAAYERALALAHSAPDCRFLSHRLAELS
jgi:predicted RNA polymerase sigma factor